MPNVYNSATTWQDLYALSGIEPGTPVNGAAATVLVVSQ